MSWSSVLNLIGGIAGVVVAVAAIAEAFCSRHESEEQAELDRREKMAARRDQERIDRERLDEIRSLKEQLAQVPQRTAELVLQQTGVAKEQWNEARITAPHGTADYYLLLFKCSKGVVSGKVRAKGSDREASFSTDVNDRIEVAVAGTGGAPVIEWIAYEVTEPGATFQIYTKGWIDKRGQ